MKPTRFTNEMIDQYYQKGFWSRESSVDVFNRNAEKYPDHVAVKDSRGGQVTWGELKIYSDRIAVELLKMGLRRDDVLVVQLPNIVENCIVRVALQKAGIIAVFPAMTLRDAEIEGIIRKANARGLVVEAGNPSYDFLAMAIELRKKIGFEFIFVVGKEFDNTVSINALMEKEVTSEDLVSLKQMSIQPHEVAFIQCTSGTTGLPKLCEWPDAPTLLHGRTTIERMKITQKDILGILAPISGGPGLSLWNAGFQVPCQMVLQERSGAEEDLKLIEKERITIIGVVPAQIIRMLRHPDFDKYDLRSLRAIRPGGAPMSPTVAKEIEERMPWCKVVVASGTSESMTLGHTHIDDTFEQRLFTVGKPWLHGEIKIVNEKGEEVPIGEEGEVLVRGACTGGGYFKDPEMTKEVWGTLGEEGWYRTGDIGKIDEDGNLRLLGRKKEIIIRGGQNIYPKEVEDMLLKHPKVADAAVVPMPDPIMGEKVCAFVITRENQKLTLEELIPFLDMQKVAKFKYPERLVVLEKFPILGTGKVDRKTLREWAAKLAEEGIKNKE
jgi:non-ribosomal peptide synthetase component E (peptide arylation enzyme)